MNTDALIRQSKTAYAQWCEQWRDHATQHKAFEKKPLLDLFSIGVGKAVLAVANGYSFEEQIEVIKQHKDNVDIMACDKTLGPLIDHGIQPTYCMVCDANVNYEKYLEPYKDKLSKTILLINVCANPKWSFNGNWKQRYFFVNKDVIDSHLEFAELSGCQNFIPAGTNVSNAMLIMLTQCDNEGKRNFFGYDKILLSGFDYSWRLDGKYYAFNETGDGKEDYMCHTYFTTQTGKFAYTSGNLAFSKDWIAKYISTFNLPIVQTSKDSLLQLKYSGDLSYQMTYRHKSEESAEVRTLAIEHEKLQYKLKQVRSRLDTIALDHHNSFIKSI